MQPPEFWYGPRQGLLPALLSPLSCLYALGGRVRQSLVKPAAAGVPVICIGNLTAGGTGKTPTAIKLVQLLKAHGWHPHILSRGYGARIKAPVRVKPDSHSSKHVGDEPLLLARAAPTWVFPDRVSSAAAAVATGADILIMDDGFQNPGLVKDVSLLVIDGGAGFGNGRVIPAGPLREPVSDGIRRANAVLVIGDDSHGAAADPRLAGLPILTGRLTPKSDPLAGQRFYAFAGIGRPEKFFETLRALGADLAGTSAFPDHHPYSVDEIDGLVQKAAAMNATLITTSKDHVRLAPRHRNIKVLEVSLKIDDETAFLDLLGPVLGTAR